MTLLKLADAAGCSESMLSKVETQRAEPSLTLLRRLASALGVNLAALFDDVEQTIVLRAGSRPRLGPPGIRRGDGISLEQLVPFQVGSLLQANIHIVEPGGGSDGLIEHEGEEVGYLLSGTLDLEVDGEVHRLGAGDSFHFRSERPHGYSNPGDSEALILWVNTPPTF
jgi:mannose-6-phosphate isomerase-like protein (cupin superfamily)/DNA-binding XRE family transcriptional regulator